MSHSLSCYHKYSPVHQIHSCKQSPTNVFTPVCVYVLIRIKLPSCFSHCLGCITLHLLNVPVQCYSTCQVISSDYLLWYCVSGLLQKYLHQMPLTITISISRRVLSDKKAAWTGDSLKLLQRRQFCSLANFMLFSPSSIFPFCQTLLIQPRSTERSHFPSPHCLIFSRYIIEKISLFITLQAKKSLKL